MLYSLFPPLFSALLRAATSKGFDSSDIVVIESSWLREGGGRGGFTLVEVVVFVSRLEFVFVLLVFRWKKKERKDRID